ncbi:MULTISPECIES: MgtC/SapB family protein [Alphaproteobacteria]|jgi:uncharacterized membrane protein (DUF4010 family)|uniref:MgtC/SapB family protein n=1 Tax=Alphaproteobacteria TaxID=28211 RepID=UPI001593FD81|nr:MULTISPECIES: MgtC/SapB family protein [Alphaproteobacteria]|tara:strand:+ start:673 stop:1932 length:1260 start_codon:yes stop_codon:yes gene_type:complete
MMDQSLELSHLLLFAQSIGIGFLIGLERERHGNAVAGLRTFTLIALAGSLGGYISKQSTDNEIALVILGLVAISLLVAQFKSKSEDPHTTTVLAGVLTFGLGYMLWVGHPILATALAVFITALLYFRKELRNVPHRLTKQDIISFLQFAAIAFILLPILPNATYGPYDVINPYEIGWLVVLISGLSLLGYVALRLFDHRSGILIVGLLGGMASTTATTLVYAKHSRQQEGFSYIAATIILLSHLVQFIRVGILVSVIEYTMLPLMIPWLVGGGTAGALFVLWSYRRVIRSRNPLPALDTGNPTKLVTAASFALLFAVVLFLSAFMNDVLADTGVFLVSFVSGLTDLDAITVSNLKLVSDQIVAPKVAAYAVILAFFANLIFKFGIILILGDRALRWPTFFGFSALSVGIFVGMISYEYL